MFSAPGRLNIGVSVKVCARPGHEPVVGDRNLQRLEADRRSAAVAGHQRDGRRERTAGTPAHDGDPRPIHPELGRVRVDPEQPGVAVLDAGRERMLGRQPVIHGDDDSAGFRGDAARSPDDPSWRCP